MRTCSVWALLVGAVGASPGSSQVPSAATVSQPAEEAAPLPAAGELIARARARQATVDVLRNQYTYRQTVSEDEKGSGGQTKEQHTDAYQMWTVDGVAMSEHVAHDGAPLSPGDAAKEHDRIEKRVADIRAGKVKPGVGEVHLSVSKLLGVSTFTNERREVVDGRPTIHFSFQGDPTAKTDSGDVVSEVFKRLNGDVWIDEADAALIHLHGTLGENYRVAGGLLVNIKAGSWFDFTSQRVRDEVWFGRELEAHADGRFLLFKGFRGDATIHWSDYQKMVATATILPGMAVVPGNAVEPDAAVDPPAPH